MRKINLSRDFLYELYVDKGMSTSEIAKELGVSRQTISNKLTEYGIEIRNAKYIQAHKPTPKLKLRKIPNYRNKATFEEAYKELKSIDLVAEHFRINVKTAFEWKKRHGIETIKEFSQRGKRKVNANKPYTNKEWLEEMYSKYSWEELGQMLNCDPTTLSKWGIKFGIKTRTVAEQWDLKSKNGSRVVKPTGFDLQLYKETYVLHTMSNLPKNLRNFIISLYGKCENPNCNESEVLDLHHIDENHKNNSPENHGVLCPNCHAKIHRLGIQFNDLVPHHISWETLLDSYQEAK